MTSPSRRVLSISRPTAERSRTGRASTGSSASRTTEDHVSQSISPRLPTAPAQTRGTVTARRGDNLADLLERVLDKGIVVAGDVTVSLASVELLGIKIRLLITSVDKAREIGINWWQHDPALTSNGPAAHPTAVEKHDGEMKRLQERLDRLDQKLEQILPALEARGRRRLRSRPRPPS
ncbi:MAG: gas vesicle protein [Polyangiaceae bacterium]|nr:gas vesicle protein [Polyangiaceae bacterium]